MMPPDEFDEMVEHAYRQIPAQFRSRMANVAVVVEDEPSPRQLAAGRVPRGSTLLGLYEGRPLRFRSVSEGFSLPDRITIFQRPHEQMAGDRRELQKLVEQTLWHEIAHYFGMNEQEVRTAERKRRARQLWPHSRGV